MPRSLVPIIEADDADGIAFDNKGDSDLVPKTDRSQAREQLVTSRAAMGGIRPTPIKG